MSFPARITLFLAATSMAGVVHAATLYWDGTDTTANADGGAGVWDTNTTNNWDSAATGGGNSLWTAGNYASFGGTGGTVTLASGISAAGVMFTANGYTLTGGSLTLTSNSNANGSSVFNVSSGVTATINSNITANSGEAWLHGGGTLILGGTNTINSSLVITGGSTLEVANLAAIGTTNSSGFALNGGNFRYTGAANGTLRMTSSWGLGAGTSTIDVTNSAATLTISAQLTNNGGTASLVKSGAGTLLLTNNSNSFNGGLTIGGGTLQIGGSGTIASQNVTLGSGTSSGKFILGDSSNAKSITVSGLSTSGTGTTNTIVGGGNATNSTLTVNSSSNTTYAGAFGGAGTNENRIALVKTGTSTLTLSGTSTHTGGTSVNAGTLKLDYATNASSKLGTGILTLGGGTLELSGGTYAESVTSTTLTASTASSITRTSGTSTINLGAITVNTGATLNFVQSGIARTSLANNAYGFLGTWATVGGANLAMNDGTGLIVAAAGTDITRLSSGTKIIANDSTANIRLIEGTGTAGNITLGAATTTINTLIQTNSGGTSAVTIDPAGQTLAVNLVMVGTGAGAMTIGTGTNNGTLKSAGTSLEFQDLAGAGITVNSIIADGTGATTVTKNSASTLTFNSAANTYSGGTVVNAGTLTANLGTDAGAKTAFSSGSITVNSGANLRLLAGSTTNAMSHANAINLNSATLTSEDALQTYSGAIALTGTNTVNVVYANKDAFFTGNISGTGGFTKTGSGALTLSGASNTFSGGVSVSTGALKLGALNAAGTGSLSMSSGTTLDLAGYSQTATAFSGAGTVTNSAASGTATLTTTPNTNAGLIFSGVIQDGTTAKTALTISVASSNANKFGLSGNNTFTGGLTVNGMGTADGADNHGILGISTDANLGGVSNVVTLNNGGALFNAQPSGATWTGATTPTLAAGRSIVMGTGVGGVFRVYGASTFTVNSVISGSGALTKTDGGTLVLAGNNTYTGGTTIATGTVTMNGTADLGTTNGISLAGSGTTLNIGATASVTTGALNLGTATAGATLNVAAGGTFNAASFASGYNPTVTVNGTMNVTGDYLYAIAATTTLNGTGALNVGNFRLGNITTVTYNAGLTTTVSGQFTTADNSTNTFNQSAGTVNLTSSTADDIRIGATGTLAYNLSGTGTLNALNSAITLGHGNTGTLSITGGEANLRGIKFGTGNSTASATLTLSGGSLKIGAAGITDGSTGTNAIAINLGGGTLGSLTAWNTALGATLTNTTAINTSGGDIGLGGALSSTGGLIKSGPGTLILSGTNTYSGSTAVNAGRLLVNGSLATASTVTVTNAGTVLGGTGTINGAISVGADAILLGGAGTATGALKTTGDVTLAAGSIIQLALGGGANTHSTIQRNGSGTWSFDPNQKFTLIDDGAIVGTTYTGLITGLTAAPTITGWSLTNAGWSGEFSYNSGAIDFRLTASPEPATYGLLGASVLAATCLRRRRRIV